MQCMYFPKGEMPFPFKNVADVRAKKNINFIKSQLMRINLLSILCNEMKGTHKTPLIHTEL